MRRPSRSDRIRFTTAAGGMFLATSPVGSSFSRFDQTRSSKPKQFISMTTVSHHKHTTTLSQPCLATAFTTPRYQHNSALALWLEAVRHRSYVVKQKQQHSVECTPPPCYTETGAVSTQFAVSVANQY